MTPPPEEPKRPHQRRPRYAGTHPRAFGEKYKELAPGTYPDFVAHIRERGGTPAGHHVPILVDEVIAALAPMPGERGVDATLGWGGHAERLLERIRPRGRLLALDRDPIELPKAEARLRRTGVDETTLIVRRTNFAGMHAAICDVGWQDGVDFILVDLGVSSMQIDDPVRGFTFAADGPLDMRMNPTRGPSAAEWLQRASVAAITRALSENADEPHAELIATVLNERRGQVLTTGALTQAVGEALKLEGRVRSGDIPSTVRRVFQAIRIEVNDEFGALDALLRQLPACLRAGGRAALIAFHSGEDRRVKRAFAEGERDGEYLRVSPEVIRPSPMERRKNPRSASAKLRWARRAG